MKLRPARIAAIASMELRRDFTGRQAAVIPILAFVLLGPIAALPAAEAPATIPAPLPVGGAVPASVRALSSVVVTDGPVALWFEEGPPLVVHGDGVPPDVRRALDADAPTIDVIARSEPWKLPGRAVILALISASLLTGSLSESIPGERARKTLGALLSAAVSREEIAAGKWLAWGGLGSLLGAAAGAVAVLVGGVAPGPWLLALPAVPAGTNAAGLWLVRGAKDVVGGTTLAVRVLPALLSGMGLVGVLVAQDHPTLAALVPLGGILASAGGLLGWADTALALVVTALVAVAALAHLARELAKDPDEAGAVERSAAGPLLFAAASSAGALWLPVLGPVAWAAAGNPAMTESLPLAAGAIAAAIGLGLLTTLSALGEPQGASRLGLTLPAPPLWVGALGGGLLLGLIERWFPAMPWAGAPLLAMASERLTGAVFPALGLAPAILAVTAQELWFRGYVQRRFGFVAQLLLWMAVVAPLDPIRGLAVALVTGLLARPGSVGPAVVARWVGLAVAFGLS